MAVAVPAVGWIVTEAVFLADTVVVLTGSPVVTVPVTAAVTVGTVPAPLTLTQQPNVTVLVWI